MHRKAIAHLKRADPVLGSVIERVGPCRLRPDPSGTHFEFVARSIVYQQLSGKAAATIFGRVVTACGGSPLAPARVARVPDEVLRAAGLSRQKLGYLRDLANLSRSRKLRLNAIESMSDDEIAGELTKVKGVGIWTAQMFLMVRLGRPDIFPVTDLGVRKGVQVAYRLRKLPPPERVSRIGEAWSPYRTVASWYMWRLLDLEVLAA
jgi:3-methyladenine DNA glycosylase/8-oxoguanine DNA glycosylase